MQRRRVVVRAWVLAVGVVLAGLVTGVTPAAAERREGPCVLPHVTGDTQVNVPFRGTTYSVLTYVPEGLRRARRVPLVVNLHGSSFNGRVQMEISGMREVADDEGFIVAAPNGAIPLSQPQQPPDPDGRWAWNVPGVPVVLSEELPPPTARDDVRFLRRLVEVLTDELCVNPRRVYVAGHSGGARMASAMGCRSADLIAGIAANAGVRAGRPDRDDLSVPDVEDCRPDRPVPVLAFHSQQDPINPYAGQLNDPRWGYSVPVAMQTWGRLNDCRRGPTAVRISENVTRLSYTRCRRGVEVDLYRVANGGHTWPGSKVPPPGPGLVTQEIDASRIMWEFFEDFAEPRRR